MARKSDIYTILATTDLSKKSAQDLFVPIDKTFLEHHQSSDLSDVLQPSLKTQALRSNEAVRAWRYVSGAPNLTSKSLVPVGILIMLYNTVFPPVHSSGIVADHPISLLIHSCDPTCEVERPSDLVPMAVVLGYDIFRDVISI